MNPNLFVDTLRELRGGIAHEEASAALASVIAAVNDTGKKGTVTVHLDIRRAGTSGAMEVAADITSKAPTLDKGTELFFSDKDGQLTRNDPRQHRLPLREVGADDTTGGLKEAGHG